MRNYEVTFIVDPVLSGDEIKATAQKYVDQLQGHGCEIVHVDETGLRQLAYPINRRNSGYYYTVEFQSLTGSYLTGFELGMQRDERLLRFLTVKLDKFGVEYNEKKRQGLIGKVKKKSKPQPVEAIPAKPKPVKPVIQQPDNLKRIEGIGPKIAEALRGVGITSFSKLASMTPDEVKNLLLSAGDRFSFQDPATWPAQADLAAKGEWDKLKKWQEELKAIKAVAPAVGGETELDEEGIATTPTVKQAAPAKTPAAPKEPVATPETAAVPEAEVTPDAEAAAPAKEEEE